MISIKKNFFFLSLGFIFFSSRVIFLCLHAYSSMCFSFFHLIGLHTLSETGILFWGKKGRTKSFKSDLKEDKNITTFSAFIPCVFSHFCFPKGKEKRKYGVHTKEYIFFLFYWIENITSCGIIFIITCLCASCFQSVLTLTVHRILAGVCPRHIHFYSAQQKLSW